MKNAIVYYSKHHGNTKKLLYAIAQNGHFIGYQRVQGDDLIFAVANNLSIGIAPEEQMGHEGLTERKGTRFQVRLIMEQSVQWMVDGFFFTAVICMAERSVTTLPDVLPPR